MIELIVYSTSRSSSSSVKICKELKKVLKYSIVMLKVWRELNPIAR